MTRRLPKAAPEPTRVRFEVNLTLHETGGVQVETSSYVNRPKDAFRAYADTMRELLGELCKRPRP